MSLTSSDMVLTLVDAVAGTGAQGAYSVVNRRFGQNHSSVIAIDASADYALTVEGRYMPDGNWLPLASRTQTDSPVFEIVPAPDMRVNINSNLGTLTVYLQK